MLNAATGRHANKNFNLIEHFQQNIPSKFCCLLQVSKLRCSVSSLDLIGDEMRLWHSYHSIYPMLQN